MKKTKYKNIAGSLDQSIENTYAIMAQREDVEVFDEKNNYQKLPSFGVQTHAEYIHTVDNFFQKIRRRIAMLERPIHSASTAGRTWNGYSAYNPQMIVKLLDIFRVVHNYIDITKKKRMVNGKEVTVKMTPAMRLGLAEAPIGYQDVICFEG